MKTSKGDQCDACSVMAEKGDQFFQFIIPMVATATDPKIPAKLMSCPVCRGKIKNAIALKDPTMLPPGRLRRVLERIKSREFSKLLKLY